MPFGSLRVAPLRSFAAKLPRAKPPQKPQTVPAVPSKTDGAEAVRKADIKNELAHANENASTNQLEGNGTQARFRLF